MNLEKYFLETVAEHCSSMSLKIANENCLECLMGLPIATHGCRMSGTQKCLMFARESLSILKKTDILMYYFFKRAGKSGEMERNFFLKKIEEIELKEVKQLATDWVEKY